MKTLKVLKEERAAKWLEASGLVKQAETEKRDLSADETTKYDNLVSEIESMDSEITRAEKHEQLQARLAGASGTSGSKETKEEKDFSLVKFMREAVNGSLTGVEAEMHQEAEKEARQFGKEIVGFGIPSLIFAPQKRDHQVTDSAKGGITVPTFKQGFIEPLRGRSMVLEMGAQLMTGLTGNIDNINGTATVATWEGEIDDNADTSMAFDKVPMTPHRLGAITTISKQLLLQSSLDVENLIRMDLIKAITTAVDKAAISGNGGGGILGILGTVGIGSVVGGASGSNLSWAQVVALEKEVAIDNADFGSLGYLTNPKVRAQAKTVEKASNTAQFLWQDGATPLNGYRAGVTTQVPSDLVKTVTSNLSALIFGNWDDLMIGQWGGLDIVVDPYTAKKKAQIEIAINSFWEAVVRRPESFAAMLDITAS